MMNFKPTDRVNAILSKQLAALQVFELKTLSRMGFDDLLAFEACLMSIVQTSRQWDLRAIAGQYENRLTVVRAEIAIRRKWSTAPTEKYPDGN